MAEGTLPEPLQTRELAWATTIAAGLAAVMLVLVVLPQAYGLDPTGLGSALGTVDEDERRPAVRTDTFNVTFAPAGEGNESAHEFKLFMQEGASLEYAWQVHADANTTPEFFYDMHGEPEEGPKEEFTSYETGLAKQANGTLTAAFTGTHGWYWSNEGDANATITLTVTGPYRVVGQLG